ncbi:unnamed protein product [Tilletia laevis]|nr:hypothetical protein CF335_g8992 [Tilletia laevis]CAD6948612.1 unnamed protein product [Tilletia laevis]
MSFMHDPTLTERAIHPWPNSSVRIPKDIVDLARHGTQIPLIWLTVEGMLEVSARGRKLITIPPTPKVQEQLAAAHEKDRFLPRGAFSQALQALVVLWTAVGPQPIDGGASQASLLEDLHLVILAQAVDEHWPIWRCYAKKVLDWVFEERGPGEGIGVDIAKVNERIVAEAERDCRCPPGRASDFTNTSKTMVAQLLRAEGEDVGRLGAVMDELHMSATFGKPSVERESATGQQGLGLGSGAPLYALPPSGPRADRPPSWIPPAAPRWSGPSHYASAHTPSWQRRDFDRGPQPFSRAPLPYPSRDSGAWPSRGPRPDRDYHQQRTPQFCTTCLEIVTDHDFRTCRRPHNNKLEQYNGGWRYPGKDLPYCHRFNSGGDCAYGCTYGHYCSACGDSKCRAKNHLRSVPVSK